MSNVTKHLRVFGRVQGVGYRNWIVQTARDLNLTGWVRNRKDGSVEIIASGHDDGVRKFLNACHKGPSSARVETIKILEGIDEGLKTFEQRDTV